MNSYKYKFLHEAVLASVAAIVTMSTCHDARAVHINPDGLASYCSIRTTRFVMAT